MVTLLDSVVVAAFLDRADTCHLAADRRVRALAGDNRLIVSVVTYAELLTGAGRGHHLEAAVRGFFDELIDAIHRSTEASQSVPLRCTWRGAPCACLMR